jgi:hypothetical protein
MGTPLRAGISSLAATALALTFAVAAPAVAPASAAKLKTSVTLSAPKSAAVDSTITLKGTVKTAKNRKVVKRVTVTIQERSGTATWSTAAKVKTTAKGKYTAKVTLKANTQYRARVAKSATRGTGISPVRKVTAILPPTPPQPPQDPPPTIQPQTLALAPISPAGVEVGGEITAAGTASPGLIGYPVHLQLYAAGVWTTVASGAVGADGSFAVRATTTTPGRLQARVLSGGNPAGYIGEAMSGTQPVDVFRWIPLTDMSRSSGSLLLSSERDVRIDGTVHRFALVMPVGTNGGNAFAEYKLGGLCTDFRATLGVTSLEDPAATYAASVQSDGQNVWNSSEYVDAAHALRMSTALAPGTNEFRLQVNKVVGAPGYKSPIIVGSPELRCAK